MSIPVIDVFAGPGGLGEGFSSLINKQGDYIFDITLSIEMDEKARETLLLRTFFRQFKKGEVPDAYYEFIQMDGYVDVKELRNLLLKEGNEVAISKYDRANKIARQAELGKIDEDTLDNWITEALRDESGSTKENWVLVGGPPCQAYSLVGRSRRGGIKADDPRVYLYREYYRILAKHNPPVFVMENVKGLLSAKVEESPVFEQILRDIKDPVKAYSKLNGKGNQELNCPGYNIFSLVRKPREIIDDLFDIEKPYFKHSDFIIKSEEYGIPQARHRVILLGIRKDFIDLEPGILDDQQTELYVEDVLKGLPQIRSGLSKKEDSKENWKNEILKLKANLNFELASDVKPFLPKNIEDLLTKKSLKKWINRALELKTYFVLGSAKRKCPQVEKEMREVLKNIELSSPESKGAEFIKTSCSINSNDEEIKKWYLDHRLKGICNHSARGHMGSDLHRYLFASSFAAVKERSPKLENFPPELLPNHSNVYDVKNFKFADRFRVQLWNEQAKTITSHISKDGHYYIHPDTTQCRSLTVREAARIQTFPDNYFFCGPRTSQYVQVGNAVPPLLANKIAKIVHNVLNKMEKIYPKKKV